nr:hypothetical protein 2 [Deltaproteobacteria bacterium]
MTPKEIKAALVLSEITAASIAKSLGVTRACISQIISGARKSRRPQKAIAVALGKEPWEVFSDYPTPNEERSPIGS